MNLDINRKKVTKNAFRVTKNRKETALRVRVPGGEITGDLLIKVSEIANTFGNGKVHMTTRQGFEIMGIPWDKMDECNKMVQSLIDGLSINQDEEGKGYTAAGTRNIASCIGNKVCPKAQYNTTELAKKIEKAVFPHDFHFKIALTGCPNDCQKVRLHDFGIIGMTLPKFDSSRCISCGRCEKKCRKQEKLIEIINKKIPDKISYKDAKGVITYCNEAFAKAYNTKIENIIGKKENEIETDMDMNPCECMNQDEEVMLCKKEKAYYNKIVDKKGKVKYLETIKIPFTDKNDNIDGLLCLTRDITTRKKLDLEFERLRTEFFANLSHEFMTPLNVIFSALQMINQTIGKCYKCENRKYR